ncbi:hypothetical protein C5167_025423 [Papaver somniferum]|uniref:Pollen allergen ole e 6 n=1 Tax=Papaver somniferum TaxID=3469 RepID=A0A4Y7JUE3_PAPSO|nr:hypothetical protein C5167_025423 [Papaver somniferum]
MARKITALFVMCIVLVAATFYVHETAASDAPTPEFVSCFNNCKDECLTTLTGQTYKCEIKCDDECSKKEAEHKIKTIFG